MTDVFSFRDVPIGDQLIALGDPMEMQNRLRPLIAEPWFVIMPDGKRMLAVGPWQVVEWSRSSLRMENTVKVLRWNVRRTSADVNKYPMGFYWDEAVMGPASIHIGAPVIHHTDKGSAVVAKNTRQYIGSQVR